jgi:hypothetical protein
MVQELKEHKPELIEHESEFKQHESEPKRHRKAPVWNSSNMIWNSKNMTAASFLPPKLATLAPIPPVWSMVSSAISLLCTVRAGRRGIVCARTRGHSMDDTFFHRFSDDELERLHQLKQRAADWCDKHQW